MNDETGYLTEDTPFRPTKPQVQSNNVIPTQFEEDVQINPEHLEFAKSYLSTMDVTETAKNLRIPIEDAVQMMKVPTVKTFINTAFMDQGYMNRGKIFAAMSKIIDMKFADLEETELGSDKDIAELLTMMHKMRMEELKLEQKENERKAPSTSISINPNVPDASNYGNLIEMIVNGKS